MSMQCQNDQDTLPFVGNGGLHVETRLKEHEYKMELGNTPLKVHTHERNHARLQGSEMVKRRGAIIQAVFYVSTH